MGRPKHATNVTPRERERMRELYRAGVRLEDIVRRTKRGMSTVQSAVRGIKRKRPRPTLQNTERDAAMLAMHEAGSSLREIGVEFGMAAAHVGTILRRAKHRARQ